MAQALGPSHFFTGSAQGLQTEAPCTSWSGSGIETLLPGQRVSVIAAKKSFLGGQNGAGQLRPSLHPPRAAATSASPKADVLLTCRQCKKSFDPKTNGPRSCKYHPAHYGGEIKRKWKSYKYHKVGTQFLYHSEETKAKWGEVETYWDCCGQNDPAHPGCEEAPHRSYDD